MRCAEAHRVAYRDVDKSYASHRRPRHGAVARRLQDSAAAIKHAPSVYDAIGSAASRYATVGRMNLRCHVAKYWGRKTYIALNRSRGSPLVEALAVKWHHPGQRQSAAFYSMPYGISRASFHVPSGCLLTMSVAVPAHTLASPDDETVLDFHSTTTSARSSPAEMILRTSNSRSGLYENGGAEHFTQLGGATGGMTRL